MHSLVLASLALTLAAHVAADTLLGCFASLPSGFSLINTYQYQSSSYCSGQCKGYAYFALSSGSNCYCGNDNPAASESTSGTCDSPCTGYGQDMCGGESSFSVYSTGVVVASSSSSSFSSSSSSSSSTKQSSSNSHGTSSSVSALNTELNLVATSSVQTSDITSVVNGDASAASDQQGTSVVFSTTFHTEGGSTIFVTNTITQSAVATGATGANGTSAHGSNTGANGSSHKKKANVGAIVGGVVGGVCGAIVIAIIALFGVRHYNMKREEDRMEKEYQEAIKPVEYNAATAPGANIMNDTLSFSSHSHSYDDNHNNKEDGMFRSSGSSGNIAGPPAAMMNAPQNPFDDSKRISTGSVFTGGPGQGKANVLTVVNPDQD